MTLQTSIDEVIELNWINIDLAWAEFDIIVFCRAACGWI